MKEINEILNKPIDLFSSIEKTWAQILFINFRDSFLDFRIAFIINDSFNVY